MSTLTHQSMTNHHGRGVLAEIADTFHVWQKRRRDRLQLAQLTSRDLHDIGISWSDIVFEAEKPFWRA